MQAKNEMDSRRRKNRILEPQKQTADEVRRYVRVRGKEHKDGGMHSCLNPKHEFGSVKVWASADVRI